MRNERTAAPTRTDQPATRFWQDAAHQAMNAIAHRIDHHRDGQPYFWLDLESDPPGLRHQSWDYCDMTGRWVDALLLGRRMTGSQEWVDVEETLRTFLLGRAGTDGFFYNDEQPEFGSVRAADLFCQGRVILGLLSWWAETGNAEAERRLDALADALLKAASWQDDLAFFPGSLWRDGRWLDQPDELGRLDPKVAPALPAPGYRTALLGGLAVYGQRSGRKDVLDLTVGLARHYLERSGAVRPDGSYTGHTHSGGVLPTTLGVLRCGLAAGREDLLDRARRVYEFTATQTTSFGWLPDGVGYPDDYFWSRLCETCALADFVELGILLSEAGLGDHWDIVERCARNQLLANQIRDTTGLLPASVDPDVAAATVGGFACAATPASAVGWRQGLEGCCLGSGLRALYLIWRHGVSQAGGTVTVNLPISRSTEAADVISEDPYAGVLRVRVKRPCAVHLRLPDVDRQHLTISRNGAVIANAPAGRTFSVSKLRPGDEIVMTYPLPEVAESVEVAGERWGLRWKGRTVVDIEPAAQLCPTYRRPDFLTTSAPLAQRLWTPYPREDELPW